MLGGMKKVVRVMPVVFACRGCELDAAARQAAALLQARGLAEASVAGTQAAKARARFPIYALEGCDKRCAGQWLAGNGVKPQRSFVLDPMKDLESELERLIDCWYA
jgi:uncharacterized metal-binding protein